MFSQSRSQHLPSSWWMLYVRRISGCWNWGKKDSWPRTSQHSWLEALCCYWSACNLKVHQFAQAFTGLDSMIIFFYGVLENLLLQYLQECSWPLFLYVFKEANCFVAGVSNNYFDIRIKNCWLYNSKVKNCFK